MNEKITLEIKPSELKKLLLDYYKKLYNDESLTISFNSKKESQGIYEYQELVTKIKVTRKMQVNLKIGNCTATLEEEIEESDIKNILQETLNESEYEVLHIIFDTKTKTYGYYEQDEIYFNGLKVDLKRKAKQKKL